MTMNTSSAFLHSCPLLLTAQACGTATGHASLLEIIHEAIFAIREADIQPSAHPSQSLGFPPRTLLAVLTYCYATDVYSARNVRNVALKNRLFNLSLAGRFPDAEAIRHFSKTNRMLLEKCLVIALNFLAEAKSQTELTPAPDTSQIADDAKRRVLMAACFDSMKLDDDDFSW